MPKTVHDSFHVAIVGAGVGGLALAMALHKKDISFTLYEEAKEYSVVGAGIGFSPNGMHTLDLIEPGFRPLYEEVCVGNKPKDAQTIFFEGKLMEKGFGTLRPGGFNESILIFKMQVVVSHGMTTPDGAILTTIANLSAHRKTLLDIMTRFIPIENVKFNKRLTNVEQRPAGVTLTFSDGTYAEADILAGTDGIQSTVREHVLKDLYPGQVAPVYAGAYCYRAVIPMSEAYEILGDLTDVAKIYFGRKRGAVTYRISGGEEFNYLLCVADSLDAWKLKDAVTERVTHEAMMADFEDPGIDDSFRQLLRKAKPIKWGLFHHLHTATYVRDRVALVGDSAHASLPFQAAGAAQGLEDALIMSNVLEELAKLPERGASQLSAINAGLTAYDSVRRPRAQKQLDKAAEVGRMIFFQHEETRADMERILSRLQKGWFNWLWFRDVNEDVKEVVMRMQTQMGAGSHCVKT